MPDKYLILSIFNFGPRKHRALCGDVNVEAQTEIELVQSLRRAGVDLDDYEHKSAHERDGMYLWTWEKKHA